MQAAEHQRGHDCKEVACKPELKHHGSPVLLRHSLITDKLTVGSCPKPGLIIENEKRAKRILLLNTFAADPRTSAAALKAGVGLPRL